MRTLCLWFCREEGRRQKVLARNWEFQTAPYCILKYGSGGQRHNRTSKSPCLRQLVHRQNPRWILHNCRTQALKKELLQLATQLLSLLGKTQVCLMSQAKRHPLGWRSLPFLVWCSPFFMWYGLIRKLDMAGLTSMQSLLSQATMRSDSWS